MSPRSPQSARPTRFEIQCSPEELKAWRIAALELNCSVSDLIRSRMSSVGVERDIHQRIQASKAAKVEAQAAEVTRPLATELDVVPELHPLPPTAVEPDVPEPVLAVAAPEAPKWKPFGEA